MADAQLTPESIFNALRDHLAAAREKHQAVMESPAYRAEVVRLDRIVFDFVGTLALCWAASTRAGDWVDRSLFMRSIDDLNQSAAMVRTALLEGGRNSARRELRYMIELAIKAIFVDQQMPSSSLEHRLVYMDRQLQPASISPVNSLKFAILQDAEGRAVAQKLLGAYSRACQYVHASVAQIKERLELAGRGITPGFETADELRQANDEAFEAFSLVVVLLFEAIGGSFAGDVWETGGLSDRDDWIFHGHPLVAAIDAHFDYKAERQAKLPALVARRADRVSRAHVIDWPILKNR